MSKSLDQKEHALQRAAAIFRIIKACAEAGLECPSNTSLAERAGYQSTSSVSDAISFLAVAGYITVERSNRSRVVTIVSSGKKTAGQIAKAHHSARVNAARLAA